MISHAFAHFFTQHLDTFSLYFYNFANSIGDNPRKENHGKEESKESYEEESQEIRQEEEIILSCLWIPKQRWHTPPLLCFYFGINSIITERLATGRTIR